MAVVPVHVSLWRASLKWVGTVASLLLVFAAIVNLWFHISFQATWWNLGAAGGGIWCTWQTMAPFDGPRFVVTPMADDRLGQWLQHGTHARFECQLDRKSAVSLSVPIWMLAIVTCPITGWLWYADRRRPALGACRCGYDLTGNASGVCPECGRAVGRVS
jgi:hypothetical protein